MLLYKSVMKPMCLCGYVIGPWICLRNDCEYHPTIPDKGAENYSTCSMVYVQPYVLTFTWLFYKTNVLKWFQTFQQVHNRLNERATKLRLLTICPMYRKRFRTKWAKRLERIKQLYGTMTWVGFPLWPINPYRLAHRRNFLYPRFVYI